MSTAIGLKDTWIGTDMFMTFANQFVPFEGGRSLIRKKKVME